MEENKVVRRAGYKGRPFTDTHKTINGKLLGNILKTFKELGSIFNILQKKEREIDMGTLENVVNLRIELRQKFREKRGMANLRHDLVKIEGNGYNHRGYGKGNYLEENRLNHETHSFSEESITSKKLESA